MEMIKIGIIGCGNISGAYLGNLPRFPILECVACADLDLERAQARADEFGIPTACMVEQLLQNQEIRIVVNLTTPQAHYSVAKAALEAGKCAYNEKPISLSLKQATELQELAQSKGLLLGGAPDTFFGGGIQTCRKLIDDGWIGTPVAATAFMMCHGHESWHPDPEFYYKQGGGPMFDMGPYYLTALINLLGPVKRVTGSTRISFPQRTITSEKKLGQKIDVEVPTHIAGIMDFASGAVGTIITSFDVWAANLPCIEIHGSLGSLSVPDPNGFGGPVRIRTSHDPEGQWRDIPLSHTYIENWRGIGVADMGYALSSGRPHRANADMASHVLELMHAFHQSSEQGMHISMKTTCERPDALPLGLREGILDE